MLKIGKLKIGKRKVMDALSQTWESEFGVSINFRIRYAVEMDPRKREFIIAESEAEHVFDAVQSVAGTTAWCYRHKKQVVIPWVFLLVAGFPCVDRRPSLKIASFQNA